MFVYVYYKFIPSTIAQFKSGVAALQSAITAEYVGVRCQLFKRPTHDQEGRETWMEVYDLKDLNTQDPQPFIDCLTQLAQQQSLPQPRANEIFLSIDTGSDQLIDC